MTQHDPQALVIYRLDAQRQNLIVAGIFTHQEDAEDCLNWIPAEASPVMVTMSMQAALAVLREEGQSNVTELFQQRLDRLAERVGQLTAVLAAREAA